jgi:trigger factor
MQVTVEKKEGINCDLAIKVPAENIDKEVQKRLQKISRTAKIDGFRPGKVPLSFLKKRHGQQVRSEVLGDEIPKSYMKAIEDEKLKAAGVDIEVKTDEPGKDFEFIAHVELFPEIEIKGFEEIEIEKPVSKIGQEEVDKMIENLRKQMATWKKIEDRGIQKEDRVKLDFEGSIDGESFEGGSAKDHTLVVGSGQMIPGFEDGVIGLNSGEEKTIEVTFPKDYQKKDLAEKKAEFKLNIKEIEEPELPELDEELVKKFGVEGDLDNFITEITANMERELKAAINKKLKEQVIDGLKKQNEIDVPKSLVKQEVQRSKQNFVQRMGDQAKGFDVSQLPDDLFEKAAKDRVAVGLIVNCVIEAQKFEASQEKIDAKIEEYASVYEDASEVRAHFKKNPQELENLKSSIIEEEMVEWVLGQAKVTEKDTDFFDLIKSAVNQPGMPF